MRLRMHGLYFMIEIDHNCYKSFLIRIYCESMFQNDKILFTCHYACYDFLTFLISVVHAYLTCRSYPNIL